ncbi:MAG: RNA polymerase sigma factor SigJ [Chloroflexota bacterium]
MIDKFENYRTFMFSIAYRMLGSAMEAEDVIHDAYLRLQNKPLEAIDNPKGYLTTIVTRLCLNQLASAKSQREQYLGPWLPEPIQTSSILETQSPIAKVEMRDSISIAFLLLLESLSPLERAAFLLHDVFGYKHQEIGVMLGKSTAACRQLLRRARNHIAENRPRFEIDPIQHAQFLNQFIDVVENGEIEKFLQFLADDVVLVPDGGGERGAAIRVMRGCDAVSAFILGSRRIAPGPLAFEIRQLNGQPAIMATLENGRPFFALFMQQANDKIQQIHVIAGKKLAYLSQ